MTKDQVTSMKGTNRILLTRGQTFWHYSVVGLVLVTPVMTSVAVFKHYVTHTYSSPRPIEELASTGYLFFIPAIVFYFIRKRRLNFQVINIIVDKRTFQSAVEYTAKELEWELEEEGGMPSLQKVVSVGEVGVNI